MLQRLREYAESGCVEGMAPTGYKETPIRYAIILNESGQFIDCLDQAQGGKGREKRGKLTIAPHVGRAYAIRPKLLADNAEYALGIARDPEKQVRVDESHQAFIELVRSCAQETGDAAVGAVLTFLDGGADTGDRLPPDFDPSAVVTFVVGETWPIDSPAVRSFWARRAGGEDGDESAGDSKSKTKAGNIMQCLVCGNVRPALERHQYKIQGIPGGHSAGMALISANAPPFESYGFSASLTSPVCHQCSEFLHKAAMSLLDNERTRVRIGPVAYIFWTREEIGYNFGSMLTDPQPDQVKALLRAPQSGQRATTELDRMQFYATAFSASGARVAVRDWLDTTVGEAQGHLARYFRLQEIVGLDGAEAPPLKLVALAGATVRELKDLTARTTNTLLHVALGGGPVPKDLLFEAVRRCRATGEVTRPQAALIKMVLLSERERQRGEDAVDDQELVRIDPGNQSPAYLCGRLLAVLEAIQREALGDINATIVDRFYGTASSAPASVFARLVRGAQPHLKTLDRDKPGLHNIFENQLMDVMQGIPGRDGFPTTLTLEDQGFFALGYYHQRASDRAERIARANRRRAAADKQGLERPVTTETQE